MKTKPLSTSWIKSVWALSLFNPNPKVYNTQMSYIRTHTHTLSLDNAMQLTTDWNIKAPYAALCTEEWQILPLKVTAAHTVRVLFLICSRSHRLPHWLPLSRAFCHWKCHSGMCFDKLEIFILIAVKNRASSLSAFNLVTQEKNTAFPQMQLLPLVSDWKECLLTINKMQVPKKKTSGYHRVPHFPKPLSLWLRTVSTAEKTWFTQSTEM